MWRNCVRLMWRLGHSAVLCPGIKVSRCRVIGGFIPAAPCSPLWNAVAWVCQSQRLKDYALPNSSWSQDMMNLYSRFLEMCKDGTWKRIPSYSTNVAHLPESLNVVSKKDWKETRLFPRNMDTEGVGFEYAMFFNPSEKRMVCLFQPGPYLEGPPGFAHGGSTATIIDSTVGGCAIFVAGGLKVMTANLSINYKNPILLGSVVLVDSKVDQIEGRKIFLSCQIRSIDGQTLHAEATALFIQLDITKFLQPQVSSQ
ncbi:acyl-coenzyme A thioesterase THEM4-like isoform X3 [Carettochelys insculpta]|uniref:acyl-coenzyme A thioesterase THEM4-like isoform X3 n=1 Tax=Carettochelys insculpta TaxID=44489 RepID=UPI003EB86523